MWTKQAEAESVSLVFLRTWARHKQGVGKGLSPGRRRGHLRRLRAGFASAGNSVRSLDESTHQTTAHMLRYIFVFLEGTLSSGGQQQERQDLLGSSMFPPFGHITCARPGRDQAWLMLQKKSRTACGVPRVQLAGSVQRSFATKIDLTSDAIC